MKYYLAVCAIFKDEGPYLAEWLRFHRRVGVEHFFLYNNNSQDDFRRVIAEAVPPEMVTIRDWPHHPGQYRAYDHCLQESGPECRWLAFFDLDEFLFSPVGTDLKPLLQDYEPYPAVVVNWLLFGSSGHKTRPAGLVTQNYLMRATVRFTYAFKFMLRRPGLDPAVIENYFPQSAHMKSIVDPSRTLRCLNPHRFAHADGALPVTENKKVVRGSYTDTVSLSRFRMNHYWSKSMGEFRAKLARGRSDVNAKYDQKTALVLERWSNQIKDELILPLTVDLVPASGTPS